MTIETTLFDAAVYLDTDELRAGFLDDALAEGDPAYIAHALGVVARAKGMTEVAAATDMKRQALYRALSKAGNPTLATVTKVLRVLGLRLAIVKA